VAKAQYGNSERAQEWTEATLTRLYLVITNLFAY
jgi:hypothetical protein